MWILHNSRKRKGDSCPRAIFPSDFLVFVETDRKGGQAAVTDADMSHSEFTILTVDDDVTIRDILGDILTNLGYLVLAAADGRTALETIKKDKPDLVLSDFLMGGMNGIDLLKRIKAESPGTPVIMFTAFSSDQLLREAELAGADGVVKKPFTLDQVRLAVEKALAGTVK